MSIVNEVLIIKLKLKTTKLNLNSAQICHFLHFFKKYSHPV